MDYALQVHEAKYVFPIPDGLKELSSDIIREVLRHQPSHINGFIADYLETMLIVRDRARDSGIVICEALQEACFFDELFKTKNITREQAEYYATVIQSSWRGYVVRRKITQWLKKKKKFEEEQVKKRSIRIEELLAGLGITYHEAKRAAGVIEDAYIESKEKQESWSKEDVPFGQRVREGDRAHGRFDRWEKEDFEDFFEIDEYGGIKYIWPRVGQIRKVPREQVPKDVPIVEFFAMRDLDGQEQYSYLIKTQPETELRGVPIGFLVPVLKSGTIDCSQAEFVNPEYNEKMGDYVYIYRDDLEREELIKFEELLKNHPRAPEIDEILGENDFDVSWVLPRALVRIRKEAILPTDDEIRFVNLEETIVCEQDEYTFRAETVEYTLKILGHLIKNKCITIEEGLVEAANMSPYKIQETGRIFPVEEFTSPTTIQKIIITPETDTAEEESLDLLSFTYIFLPPGYRASKDLPKGEHCFTISITRFQGFHSDYKGSAELEGKVFIMGPKINTPNGLPFTYESLFWDDFGVDAWYQFLHDYQEEEEMEEEEKEGEITEGEKVEDKTEIEPESERIKESEISGEVMGEGGDTMTQGAYRPSTITSEQVIEAEEEEKGIEERAGEERLEEKLKEEKTGEDKPEEEPEEKPGEKPEEKPEEKAEPAEEPKKEPEAEVKPSEEEAKEEET